MIPTSLQEVFGTLFAGLTASLLVSFCWFLLRQRRGDPFAKWLWFWFRYGHVGEREAKGADKHELPVLSGILILLIAFGIGIVTEGITDNLTDSEAQSEWSRAVWFLGSEDFHRFSTLVKLDSETGTYRFSGLGKDLIQHKTFTDRALGRRLERGAGNFLADVNAFLTVLPEDAKNRNEVKAKRLKDAETYSNLLYYPAKNWAYTQDNYFDELQGIQRRIDWSRSSFLICYYGLMLDALVLLVLGILYVCGDAGKRAIVQALCLIPILAVSAWLCVQSYEHCETQFNERAYGYYASYLQRTAWEKEDAGQAAALEAQNPEEERAGGAELIQKYDAMAWSLQSAEYAALCTQIFHAATASALEAQRERGSSTGKEGLAAGKPLAVVVDIDETMLNNMKFNAYLAARGEAFSPEAWTTWVIAHALSTEAVPGACDFVTSMRSAGIRVLFISNRRKEEREATIAALEHAGLGSPGDLAGALWLRTDESSKDARRRQVLERYDVLAYLGDNLADFSSIFEAKGPGDSVWSSRMETALENAMKEKWGTEWFVLPNPVYGDWAEAIDWKEFGESSLLAGP